MLCDLDDGTIRHSSAADRVLKQSAPLDLAFGAMLKYFASAGYPEAQLTKALRVCMLSALHHHYESIALTSSPPSLALALVAGDR